eukprot:SAG11_NODE_4821_length_1754_cov_1.427795_3_plen_127_part_00
MIPYDGIGQWAALIDQPATRSGGGSTALAAGARARARGGGGGGGGGAGVVLDHCAEGFSTVQSGCNHYGDACVGGCGALIMGGELKAAKSEGPTAGSGPTTQTARPQTPSGGGRLRSALRFPSDGG